MCIRDRDVPADHVVRVELENGFVLWSRVDDLAVSYTHLDVYKRQELFGGSADLAGSNLTLVDGSKSVTRGEGGNYCHYGVREFGMTAIANGIALHGGLIPYTLSLIHI